jgi:hypothetical protein
MSWRASATCHVLDAWGSWRSSVKTRPQKAKGIMQVSRAIAVLQNYEVA